MLIYRDLLPSAELKAAFPSDCDAELLVSCTGTESSHGDNVVTQQVKYHQTISREQERERKATWSSSQHEGAGGSRSQTTLWDVSPQTQYVLGYSQLPNQSKTHTAWARSSSLLKDISHDGWHTLVKYGCSLGTNVGDWGLLNGAVDWDVQNL